MSQLIILEKELTFSNSPSHIKIYDSIKTPLEELENGVELAELSIGTDKSILYSLVACRIDNEVHLEVVKFDLYENNVEKGYIEDGFSDCIYEIPNTAEETVELMLDYANTFK